MGLLGTLGSLNVLFSADTAQFNSAMDKAAFTAERNLQNISRKAKINGAIIAAALAAAATGFAVKIKSIINDADELGKMSQKIGVSVQSLSAFRYAAELAGTDFETMTKGIARFSRMISDASNDLETAKRPLQQLGIEFKNVDGGLRNVEDMLLDVADKFSMLENGTKKAALAQELFGRSGVELIPFLNQGREGIDKLRKEAERLGIVFDGKAAQAAENFNDNMTRVANISRGAFVQIASSVLPTLEAFSENMAKASGDMETFRNIGRSLALTVTVLANGFMTFYQILDTGGKIIGNGIATLSIFKDSMVQVAAIMNPTLGMFGKMKGAAQDDIRTAGQIIKNTAGEIQTDWEALTLAVTNNMNALNETFTEGAGAQDTYGKAARESSAVMEEQSKWVKKLDDFSKSFGDTIANSFEKAVFEGTKFRDFMVGMLNDLTRLMYKTFITQPFADALTSGLSGWLNNKGGGSGSGITVSGGETYGNMSFPSAHGNVFKRFATGGIINHPVTFPMANGAMGMAGEAGAEAILPLFRTGGGDLGVKSGGSKVEVNVYAPEGSKVSQSQEMDGDMQRINILIDDAVAGNIGNPGSKTFRTLKNSFGLKQTLISR